MAFLRHKAREYGQLALLFLGFLTGIGLVVTCGGGGGGGQQLPTSTAGTISFTTLDLGNVSSPGGTPVAIGVPPALDGVTNVQDALNRLNVVLSPELARVTDPLSSDFIMDADLPAFLRDPVTGVPITFSRRLAGLVRSSSLSGPIRADNAFALALVARLSGQVQGYRRRLELMAIRSAPERVFAGLADGRLTGSVIDFAADLGLTHEAVYRALAELVRAGRVERPARGVYRVKSRDQVPS